MQSNRGRVCIDEYARTHVHPSYKHRGVVHELLRVPSFYRPFFFPRTLFFLSYTPMDRTVYGSHMAVDNAPTFVYVHVETAFIEVVESFPMLLQPDDMALNNTTVFNLAFSCLYLFFFLPSLPSSLPFFFRRKTNSIFDYICSGYVVTRYNHLTARSKPFLRGI